jgi:hypothetical protein
VTDIRDDGTPGHWRRPTTFDSIDTGAAAYDPPADLGRGLGGGRLVRTDAAERPCRHGHPVAAQSLARSVACAVRLIEGSK